MTPLSYRHIGSLYLSNLYFSQEYPLPLGLHKYTYICCSIALCDSLFSHSDDPLILRILDKSTSTGLNTLTMESPYFENLRQKYSHRFKVNTLAMESPYIEDPG